MKGWWYLAMLMFTVAMVSFIKGQNVLGYEATILGVINTRIWIYTK